MHWFSLHWDKVKIRENYPGLLQCITHHFKILFTAKLIRTLTQPFSFYFQYFNPNKCQCECNDSSAKAACYNQNQDGGPLKEWNESTCQCRCVEQFRECSSGFVYDNVHTCSCRGFRGGSTTAVVVLIVAIVAMMGCIGFLLARYILLYKSCRFDHCDFDVFQVSTDTYCVGQSHIFPNPKPCTYV